MLTRLVVRNFKSIGDPGIELDLRPLTFLVGPNGSGKSSVLEAVALLAQTERAALRTGDHHVFLHGPLVSYPSVESIVHRHEVAAKVVIGLRTTGPPNGAGACTFRFGLEDSAVTVSPEEDPNRQGEVFDWLLKAPEFLSAEQRGHTSALWSMTSAHLTSIWTYARYERLRAFVQEWAQRFGMENLWHELGRVIYSDLGVHHDVHAASFGSRQVLQTIARIAAYDLAEQPWVSPFLMLEEPEISLHPQAQADMARLLATAAADGKQVLATTHSTYLLMGLTSAVREQIIRPEDVVILELEKRTKGTTVKKRIDLNKKGALKGWVSSFSAIERKLMRDWSETLPKV